MSLQRRDETGASVTRVEFALSDRTHPFVHASTLGEESLALLEEVIPRGDGCYAEFFTISGVDRAQVLDIADEHGSLDVSVLRRKEDRDLYEFEVTDSCPVVFLGERGAMPRAVYSIDGEGQIAAEIPPSADANEVVEEFLDAHQDAELVAKRPQRSITPLFSHRGYRQVLENELTGRQQTVIETAMDRGYYEWPRDVTAKELAEVLDVSEPTLHKHLRAAEQQLVSLFFEKHPDVRNRLGNS